MRIEGLGETGGFQVSQLVYEGLRFRGAFDMMPIYVFSSFYEFGRICKQKRIWDVDSCRKCGREPCTVLLASVATLESTRGSPPGRSPM